MMLGSLEHLAETFTAAASDLTPAVLATCFSMFAIGAALFAVVSSRSDSAAEKHAVLVVSVAAAGASLLLSILVRPFMSEILTPSPPPPLLHRAWVPGLTIGFIVFAGMQTGGFLLVRREIRKAKPPSDDLILAVRKAAADMGLYRPPAVWLSDSTQSPYVTLTGRGTIMLPTSFEQETYPIQRGVLMHEVAHIRRADCWTHLICQFCGVLLWWNPLYWMAMQNITLEREIACDAAVIHGNNDISWYADVLSRFAQRATSLHSIAFASAPMAMKSTLRSRLERLDPMTYRWCHLDLKFSPMSRHRMIAWVALIVLLVLSFETCAPSFIESLAIFSYEN